MYNWKHKQMNTKNDVLVFMVYIYMQVNMLEGQTGKSRCIPFPLHPVSRLDARFL